MAEGSCGERLTTHEDAAGTLRLITGQVLASKHGDCTVYCGYDERSGFHDTVRVPTPILAFAAMVFLSCTKGSEVSRLEQRQ